MPTYVYRCNDCGHEFERFQRMSDDPLKDCEVCGGEVARLLFAPAIHFKGTGFHNTDYASKKRSRDGEAAPASDNGAAAKPDGGGGDKPATKEATTADTATRTAGP